MKICRFCKATIHFGGGKPERWYNDASGGRDSQTYCENWSEHADTPLHEPEEDE